MTTEPAAKEPTAQESAVKEPAAIKPIRKKVAHKKRAPKKATKKRAAKKSVSKKRPAKKRAAKKRVAKKSSTKKPPSIKTAAKKSRKRKAKKQPAVINKAQAIRDTATTLGKKARPKDVIAALAEKKITVSSAQVSITLKAAGLRRGRRRRKVVAVASQPSMNGHGFIIDELIKVKKLADELGGTGKLKELATAIEQLL